MNKKLSISLSLLVAGVILVWIMFANANKEQHQPILLSTESGSYPEKSLEDLIYEADAIVVGQFESAYPSQWNTTDGELPDGATIQTVYDQNLYVYTEYIFKVDEFLKGDQHTSSITIRTFGGQVGEDIMASNENFPHEIGKTYLLFLNYDPRLAHADDPGPFLIFDPATFVISNGKATSWMGEWNEEELLKYIKFSPFTDSSVSLPDTPETNSVIEKIKTAYDIEVEAKQLSDFSKLPDVFINDPRYPIDQGSLEVVRAVTDNPSINSAGYLDYKIAYHKMGGVTSSGETPLASIWIEFISVKIHDDEATAIIEIGQRGMRELRLVLVDENWYIAGSSSITAYGGNSLASVLAPSIQNTEEFQAIIRAVENTYDIEAEAIYTLDFTKLPDVFANDPRYLVNSNQLEIVRNVTDNPSLVSAGYLDYKLAYYGNWTSRPQWAKSPNRDRILQFLSIQIDGNSSTVYLHDGYKAIVLHLVRVDNKWYVAGEMEN